MPTIVHFDIPVDDVKRAQKFYSTLFGWEIKDLEMPGMEYYSVMTSGDNPVNGGMTKRQQPQESIRNYINVDSLDESAAKIEELGGQIIVPKTAVPTMGWFALCLDTENNTFGIWQNDQSAK